MVDAPDGASSHELALRLHHDPRGSLDGGGQHARSAGASDPLLHGSSFLLDKPRPRQLMNGLAQVVVISGPDAGAALSLCPGQWMTIGRDRGCDLMVEDRRMSRRHARIRQGRDGFAVEDLGSTNGVRFEDGSCGPRWPPDLALEVGGSRLALVLEPLAPLGTTPLEGRLTITPWPRHVCAPTEISIPLSAEPQRRAVPAPSTWAWALPLVVAGAVAFALRMPWMVMFGLLGPAMVIGQYLGDRRTAQRVYDRAAIAHQRAVSQTGALTTAALAGELRVRRSRDPGVLGARTALFPAPSVTLWSRAREAPAVVVGEGPVESQVTLGEQRQLLDHAPVVLHLDEPVVVVGHPSVRDALVRSWLVQLTTSHPPRALCIVIDPTDTPEEWDLLAWLPHTRPRPVPGADHVLVWARDLVLVEDLADAPLGMTRVVVGEGVGTIQRPGERARPFVPTLLSLPRARALVRALAPLTERCSRGPSGPATLGSLTPWPTDEADACRLWHQDPGVTLRVPIGTDDAGSSVEIDLAREGPHALIAGTTGSGKSELLRTLVTGLALRNPPSRLSFLLIDYKGGSSLGECAAFPQATGLITDLDPHLAQRVLISLQAELRRREAVLADDGARDVRDYHGAELPRLVIVIDEFRVLRDELPAFLDGLVRVAAVGRSLGVHLILATQRPAGVITADLRANVNLRIALRLRDVSDSRDVIDTDAAAHLPEGAPGHALLRTGTDPPRRVLVAPAAPAPTARHAQAWSIHEERDVWDGWRALHRPPSMGIDSDLGALGTRLDAAASAAGDRARPVWTPPLPEVVRAESVWTGPQHGTSRAWALSDRPQKQDREPLVWGVDSHLAIVGAARTGRSQALASIACSAGRVWLYVLDLGRGLEPLGLHTHPGVRAWMDADDVATGLRIVETVNDLIDERLARPAADRSPVVVLLDGWDRWVETTENLDRGIGLERTLRLIREGPGAHVFVVLSGDRALLLGKVATQLPQTWALRLHDPNDLLLTGLRRAQLPVDPPPGRLVRTSDGRVAQVVLTGLSAVADLAAPEGPEPARVVSLPRTLDPSAGWAVGGDAALSQPAPEGSFLVVGPPGAGVTTALEMLASTLPTSGSAPLVVVGAGSWTDEALGLALTNDVATVIVDDVHLLAGTLTEDLVLAWVQRTGGRLLVGGELDACSAHFRGLVPMVARLRSGLVLQPRLPSHGQLLGVHLPVGDLLIPGRGVLVERGRCLRVQVADPARRKP